MADPTPRELGQRAAVFSQILSYAGMGAACQAGLRPARKVARRKNYGFTDRTGKTRKAIAPVRRYTRATAYRYRGGGAYFRGGPFPVGPVLEYRYGGRYQYLAPAVDQTEHLQLREFVKRAEKETTLAVRRARQRGSI